MTLISSTEKHQYAQVLLRVGTALKENQSLCLEAPVEQADFTAILAQEAQELGCKEIGVIWRSGSLDHAFFTSPQLSSPDAVLLAKYYAQRGAAYLRLDSPQIKAGKQLPASLLLKKTQEHGQIREIFRKYSGGSGQAIACVPGRDWADVVFGDLPQDQRLNALWDAVLLCSRCKEPDPLKAWSDYLEHTARRKELLQEKGFTAFHYYGDHADLTLEPSVDYNWKGSCIRSADRISVPNIPTEEVFITPHKYRTNGWIASTLPLNYGNSLIEGIELEFQEGRITGYTAKSGADLLALIIETDEGSHYLGEMALVDQSSPVAQQKRIFYTTLYDENASCHLAIGNALGPKRDLTECEKLGINTSSVHVDIMVGDDSLSIDGRLPDGNWQAIFRKGRWAL